MNNKLYRYKTDCVEIEIKKPLYGSFVYVRDAHIRWAKAHKIPLRITIPQGTFDVSPDGWLSDGKRIEKVFLIPDKPMVLWGNSVFTVFNRENEKGDEQNV